MRLRQVALLILTLLGLAPVTALAHGGHSSPIQTFTQLVGPYELAISVEMPANVPGPLYLVVAPHGDIGEATIRIRAVPRGFPLNDAPVAEVRTFAGTPIYYTQLEASRGGDWELDVQARGTRGSGHVRIPFAIVVTPLAPETIPLALALGGAVLLVISRLALGAISNARGDTVSGRAENLFGYALFGCLVVAGVLGAQQFLRQSQATIPPSYGSPHANAVLLTEPALPEAGKPFSMTIDLSDGSTGLPIDDLATHHDALMHLVLISTDNTVFIHTHPGSPAAGQFVLPVTLPQPGIYSAYIEIERINSGVQVIERRFEVSGKASAQEQADPITGLGQRIIGDLAIDLSASLPEIPAGRQVSFKLNISQAGKPVTDIEPWLGMAGHLLTRSADGSILGHVHAAGTMSAPSTSAALVTPPSYGPDIQFIYTFPKSGTYHLWAQFQHAGQVITVPFVVEVKGGL